MNKVERALNELNEMDELADVSSPVHRLPALSKLLTTLIFIIITMSYGRHDLTVIWMAVYPYIVFQLSRIPFRTCLRKIRFLLPFVIFAGIFNPLFDTEILINLGKIYLSGGQVSFIVIVIKGVLALSGAFLLAATARIDAVCAALRRLHVPPIFTTLILLTYRYGGPLIPKASPSKVLQETIHWPCISVPSSLISITGAPVAGTNTYLPMFSFSISSSRFSSA